MTSFWTNKHFRDVPTWTTGRTYLAGDKVFTDRQRHLDGVGFVGDGDGVQFELLPAVDLIGLGHCVLKDLFVPFLAQNRTDVDDLRFAARRRTRAGEERHHEEETHGGVKHQAAQLQRRRFSAVSVRFDQLELWVWRSSADRDRCARRKKRGKGREGNVESKALQRNAHRF